MKLSATFLPKGEARIAHIGTPVVEAKIAYIGSPGGRN
jgi:hypothetical protein